MSSDYHTPISQGANADDSVFNAPLGELDQALFDIIEGNEPFDAVRIGDASLDPSAIFQVESDSQGVLFPRMTEAQRDAIASPAEGLIVYNSDDDAPNYYDGGGWTNLFPYGAAMQPITPVTPISAVASISITSIPQTYQDLLFRLRIQIGTLGGFALLRFNNASGSSDYVWSDIRVQIGQNSPTELYTPNDSKVRFTVPGSSDNKVLDLCITIRNYTLAQKNYGEYEGIVQDGYIWGGFEFSLGGPINRIDVVPASGTLTGYYSLYGIGG